MINVVYHKLYNRLTVDGHAGSGPEGHDLVCAGVSALALTLAVNVEYLDGQKVCRADAITLDPGHAEIACVPIKKGAERVRQLFETICVGFEVMETQHPDCIHYEVRG